MSAISLSYKGDLAYAKVIDNTLILRKNENDEVIIKFPIPKPFRLSGIIKGYGGEKNMYTCIMTPYELKKPKFIPKGYQNLRLDINGTWTMDNGRENADGELDTISYIDTTILSAKHFEYPTIGKFKIREDEIPAPFWVRNFTGPWRRISDIQKDVKEFDKNARLIHEEELISIFAYNDFGMEWTEHISDNVDKYLSDRSHLKYFVLGDYQLDLDNWDMVAASREDRSLYKFLYKGESRMLNEKFWYRNKTYMCSEYENVYAFHVFPVLDDRNKGEIDVIQPTSGSEWKNELRRQASTNEWKNQLRQQTRMNQCKAQLSQQTSISKEKVGTVLDETEGIEDDICI